MIKFLVGLLLKPLVGLGEKYLDNQKDKNKLAAGITETAIKADTVAREAKFLSVFGRIPLFIAEASVALYVASVMIDSTFPSEWINPLRLPTWFEPHFSTAMISVFGLVAVERASKRFGK